MASYNLNNALKAKTAKAAPTQQEEMHLDDVARVKVLSPGRQVFKRFIRNRLAVFGSILLILMFVFSFFGPVIYPYGQKQIFYKYDSQNVNYALAKENTGYTGYTCDENVEINRNAASMMNTNIKKMQAEGLNSYAFVGDDGAMYSVDFLGENIYTLSRADAEAVCTFGSSNVHVGTLDSVKKAVKYTGEALDDGFGPAAAKACKGASGSFDYNGIEYTFEKGKAKSFEIYCVTDGFIYTGEAMDAEFEAAAAAGVPFDWNGSSYIPVLNGESGTVYQAGEKHTGMVFTRYALDTYETGVKISNEFRCSALLNAWTTGAFTADGENYTVAHDGEALLIYDAQGNEFAEFTSFVMRRYNGDDTMDYDLKNALRTAIETMLSENKQSTSFSYNLPMQNDAGEYSYDADGNLQYNETELKVTQKDTGEFVVNCDQIIYVIDIYASPSLTHILGTDGDGFDVMSRIMYGGRISLMVGFVVVFLESFLGIIMGGLAGYYGGWVDNLIMRLVDIFYCLPSTPIMIILGAMMDAMRMDTYIRLMIMMAALGIMGWAGVARMVRGQILSLREQEFMVATEATGVRIKARIFRHLVPNVMPQLIVSATMGMGGTILTESTLSYLGLGVKHPLATWGTIINSVSSASAMAHYAHIWIPVGLLICLTVIAFNFVGDGLRDAYDPKSKR